MRARTWVVLGVAAMVMGLAAATIRAQEKEEVLPVDGEGRVVLSWDTFKEVTKWDEARPPAEEPGVFTLSWEEVQDLLGIKIENVAQAKVRIPWQEF